MAVASAWPYASLHLAPESRPTTTPAPHYSVFTDRMPFLPPNQQRQSTEGNKGITLPCNVSLIASFLTLMFYKLTWQQGVAGFLITVLLQIY